MENTKYNAIWVSHSTISDFLKCPKAYYLKNVHKNPKTNHKIAIINPALALGQIVHKVLESLSSIKAEERLSSPLIDIYEKVWQEISGKKGGFKSKDEKEGYKARGRFNKKKGIKKSRNIKKKTQFLKITHTTDHSV